MCRETYKTVQGYIQEAVHDNGGLWVVTLELLREELLEAFPDLDPSADAVRHPTLQLERAAGLRSHLLDGSCRSVVVIYDPHQVEGDCVSRAYSGAVEGDYGEEVRISMVEAGICPDAVDAADQLVDDLLIEEQGAAV